MSYPPIADYALIGDCHTGALVSRAGAVDWYCPGRFDAPALFCRLLDWRRGGFFQVAPTAGARVERRYQPGTTILETTFHAPGGVLRLTDCMPVFRRLAHRRGYDAGTRRRLLRLVEVTAGEVEVEVRFKPTFGYAASGTDLHVVPDRGVVARDQASRAMASLACPGVAFEPMAGGGLRGRIRLRQGERHWLALADAEHDEAAMQGLDVAHGDGWLETTAHYWRTWAAACTYRGAYQEQVLRSALTLKLLSHEPTGAIVAAPTTSLPEQIGGIRNWDYRYTWLRDSALILYALLTIGFDEEAEDFIAWLGRATREDVSTGPQIMYGIFGEHDLAERTLDLDGYRGSRPVRVGNAAAGQRQLDIYGEVVNAAYLHFRQGHHRHEHRTDAGREQPTAGGAEHPPGGRHGPAGPTWALLRRLVQQAADNWQEPDNGIWEVRGGQQHFLYSKLMCWVALDRGIRLAREDHLEAPVEHWRRVRAAIREAILARGFDARQAAFTQAFGSAALDATALVIPRVGFLPATDPRVLSTVDRVQAVLGAGFGRRGLIHRYRAADGLCGDEGAFLLCSFWLVDALALSGRVDEGRRIFEEVIGLANDVGLLSEEVDPRSGEALGNFPQGFTHLALVGAAVNLTRAARHGAEHEAATEGDRAAPARHAARQGAPSRTRRTKAA